MKFCKKYFYYFMFLVLGINFSGCTMESGDMIKLTNNSNENICMLISDTIMSNNRVRDYFIVAIGLRDNHTIFSIRDSDIIIPGGYLIERARYGSNGKSNPPYFVHIFNYDSLKSTFNKDQSLMLDRSLCKIIRVDYWGFEKTNGEFTYKSPD